MAKERNYDPNYLANKIAAKLKADRITLTDAAKLIGIDQGTLSKMFRAASFRPNLEIHFKVCQWLEIPMESCFRENVLPIFQH